MADMKFRQQHPQGPTGQFIYNGGRHRPPRALTPPAPPVPMPPEEPDLNPPPPPVPAAPGGFTGDLGAFGDTWYAHRPHGGRDTSDQMWESSDGASLTIHTSTRRHRSLTMGRAATASRQWTYMSPDNAVTVMMDTDGTNSPITLWHMRNADRAMHNQMEYDNTHRDPRYDAPVTGYTVSGDDPWEMRARPTYGPAPKRPPFWRRRRRKAWDAARAREARLAAEGTVWMDDTKVTPDVQRMLGDHIN